MDYFSSNLHLLVLSLRADKSVMRAIHLRRNKNCILAHLYLSMLVRIIW